MIKNFTKISFMAAALFLFAQCGGNSANNGAAEPVAQKSGELQSSTAWKLESMKLEGAEVALPTDQDVTIILSDSSRLSGNSGCNLYFGSYQIDTASNGLTLAHAGMTKMAGPNMEFEQKFLANMTNVKSYSLIDSTLTLCDSLGREIMVLSQSDFLSLTSSNK